MINIYPVLGGLKACGTIVLTTLVFLLIAHHSAFGQALSVPLPIPGDTSLAVPPAGKQERPQIARGSDTFLAVWADTRSALAPNGTISVGGGGPYFGHGLGTMNDISAARLDAAGNVIDQHPIVVSQAPYNQNYPQVAWNGENWLVVWYQEKSDNYYEYEIRGVRVSPAGVVLDATPIMLGTAGNNLGSFPAELVFDGTNWIVIWEAFRSSSARSVYAARISASGAVLDPQGVQIYDHPTQSLSDPDIAFNGSGFLLTFMDGDAINGLRLSLTLQPIGTRFLINGYSPSSPVNTKVASNGDGYFVVWDEHPFSGNIGSVRGARVTATGTVLDPTSIVIAANVGTSDTSPDVAWNGTNWFIAYDSGYDSATGTYTGRQTIYSKRVSPAGTVLDDNPFAISSSSDNQLNPAIEPGFSGAVQVVWEDLGNDPDVFTRRVAANGGAGDQKILAAGAPRHNKPKMAFGGNVFLAVFERQTSEASLIYAQRLNADGLPLDAEPVLISNTDNLTNANPSVAFNGTHFLVVWDRQETDTFGNIFRRVYGKRVMPAGTPVESIPFFIMDGLTPDVAALGDTFLTVAIRPIGSQLRYVESVRVTGTGTVLGPASTVLTNFNHVPRVAALGNRWLVIWEYHSRHDSSPSSIRGRFVNPDGSFPAESFQVAGGDPGSFGNYDDTPHLAVAGNEALIVWQNNDLNLNDIKGRRITAEGTLLDDNSGFLISGALGNQYLPAVAWDGSRYVVTWVDQRNDQSPQQPRGDIFAARVAREGTVIDAQGFPVGDSPLPEDRPWVAARTGLAVFAYSKLYNGPPFSAMRVTVRSLLSSVPRNGSPFDFDGDGKTDLGIFRPSVGEWWINGSSTGATVAAQFGASTDVIVPADYTGDGKTDIAFWRPSTGEWYVLRSEDSSFYSVPFGTPNDIPAPADFDSDGKADTAIFRPSSSTWFIQRSGDNGTTIQQFGTTGDQPVAADYDGDGKADIAIYRPSNGQWWLNRSTTGVIVYQFGASTDKAVQGDYTGDGKSDVAFWRPSTGEWYILRSEDSSYYSAPFGTTGDIPAPGDYDGDGKFDTTVFRPSNTVWYSQRTTAGILIQQFGATGDQPVANSFVR